VSRASIVAMLIAVEVVIVGIALYAVRGAAAMHHADFAPKTFALLNVGAAPQVDIDDADSHVDVSVSSDGLVHVRDLTRVSGTFFGTPSSVAKLQVERTAGGVSVQRAASSDELHVGFDWSEHRIEVEIPDGSHVRIARCSGASVSGISGGVTVASQDGRITLADLRGSVDASSDDGSIRASSIRGDNVTLQTKDGSIDVRGLEIADGARRGVLHTSDGTIRVALEPNADLTVDASTNDGHIEVDGNPVNSGDSDSAQHTIRLGNGSGSLQLSSGDGSIHILTNGAV